jgi:hypothetical protein
VSDNKFKIFFSNCSLADGGASATFAAIKDSNSTLIGFAITVFVFGILFWSALFRYCVAHNNDDMGLFGTLNSGLYNFAMGMQEGLILGCDGVVAIFNGIKKGISCRTQASNPPSYMVSPHILEHRHSSSTHTLTF